MCVALARPDPKLNNTSFCVKFNFSTDLIFARAQRGNIFFLLFDSLFLFVLSIFRNSLVFFGSLSMKFYEFLNRAFRFFFSSLPQLELKTSRILNKTSGWWKGKSFSLLIFVSFAVKKKNFLIFVAHAFPASEKLIQSDISTVVKL